MSKYQIVALTLPSPFYKGDVSRFGASFYIDGKLIDKFETTDFGTFIEKGKFPKNHAELLANSGRTTLDDFWSRFSANHIDETLETMNKEFVALLETEKVDVADETTYHSYFKQRMDRISAERLSEMALLVPSNPDGTKDIEVLADNATTQMFISRLLANYQRLFRDFEKFPETDEVFFSGWSLYKFDEDMRQWSNIFRSQKFLIDGMYLPSMNTERFYRWFVMMRETSNKSNEFVRESVSRFVHAESMGVVQK